MHGLGSKSKPYVIPHRLCWIPGRKKGFFLNVVKFFFSRLTNFCFSVYVYLFVKFSGLFLPATLTRTRDVYPHPHPRPLPASRDPRHLDILGVNWLPPRTIVAHVFLKIIFRGCPIIHSFSNGAMLERLAPGMPHYDATANANTIHE